MAKRRNKKGHRSKDVRLLSEKLILDILRDARRPSFMREIVKMSGVDPGQRRELRELVRDMVSKGDLLQFSDQRYTRVDKERLLEGRLSMHPDGFAFVIPEEGGEDIFIPPGRTGNAIHGDMVRVTVTKIRKKGPEGMVVSVLKRKVQRIAGVYRKEPMASIVVPDDERLLFHLYIPSGSEGRARDGDAVLADIVRIPEDGKAPEGRVVEVLGDPSEPEVQVRMVMAKFNLQERFSEEAEKEAGNIREEILAEDLRGRKDIRGLELITIDGEDARDFDDAVHVKKNGSGYVLTVAIADVSHYVTRGMAMDTDAKDRGTSIYFPSSVLPMLPEKLSNNLCSLMPDVDRLAMVARITYDNKGRALRSSFFKAVIRSCRRFTYKEVNRIFDGDTSSFKAGDKGLFPMLNHMRELSRLLFKNRIKRGSIDFNIPEVAVILDDAGSIVDMERRERGVSNRMIEEFMLAANEAVAEFLVSRGAPVMFRIHEEPDPGKLEDFVSAARSMGLNLEVPEKITPKWFQMVLKRVAGTPKEYMVNSALLRTMQQAVYSERNEGHFGLASDAYLHFTSPIRRYPDLVIHRILKGNLRKGRKRPVYTLEKVASLAVHLSGCERNAVDAEREMLDRLKVAFMAERTGEIFPAVISSVTPNGFFVELRELLISGLVKAEDLKGDYYRMDRSGTMLSGKRSGRKFVAGDEIKVKVKSVSIERRRIDFGVAD